MPLARLTHVNINYRYKPDEVRYILDNSDAQAMIFGAEFRETVAEIRDALPNVKTFIEVTTVGEIAPFAEYYDAIAGEGTAPSRHHAFDRRHAVHLYWRHDGHAQGCDVAAWRSVRSMA